MVPLLTRNRFCADAPVAMSMTKATKIQEPTTHGFSIRQGTIFCGISCFNTKNAFFTESQRFPDSLSEINLNKLYLYAVQNTPALQQLIQQPIVLGFDKQTSKFSVRVADQIIQQNVCEFLLTSSFLVGQDVEEFLLSTDSCYDTVRVPLTTAGKSLTLELGDFIRLREAYGRQLYLLKLEDLLLHRGITLSK